MFCLLITETGWRYCQKKKKKKNEEKLQGEASSSKESIHSAVSQPLGFLCVKQSGKQL